MPAPIPVAIQPVLNDYLALVDQNLPGFLYAFYLQGSIALGAFNERHSDIDFIALISRDWTAADREQLLAIHRHLKTQYTKWPLEGIYLNWPGQHDPEKAVKPYLYFHDAVLVLKTDLEINDVTWWVLKQRGITLRGPKVEEFDFEVEWPVLLSHMKQNQNTYWAAFTRKPGRIAWLLTDSGVSWAVLGTLRQYYSFKENDITSKEAAGKYALANLPARWHCLVREALNLRGKPQPSLYKTKVARAIEAFRFLRYVRQLCNRLG